MFVVVTLSTSLSSSCKGKGLFATDSHHEPWNSKLRVVKAINSVKACISITATNETWWFVSPD